MSIDLDKPRYDQSTYMGRAKHFLLLTNPMNAFASDAQLDEAKEIVTEFRRTRKMPPGFDEDKLWATKYLYDSAFHPDTGEKMIVLGRMAAQAPMNTIITGCMVTFYKTTAATAFWQWVNQTFNALVNYTNRSGDAPMPMSQLIASYCAACGGALTTALYLNSKVKANTPLNKCAGSERRGSDYNTVGSNYFTRNKGACNPVPDKAYTGSTTYKMVMTPWWAGVKEYPNNCDKFLDFLENMSPIYSRLVPFAAVCGANFINIPMMRSTELLNGTPVFTADGQRLGESKNAARLGIGLVIISRVFMALPGMTVTPMITNYATKRGLFCKRPMMVIPFQLFLVGLCVTFATPLCCAIFEQRASIAVDSLDSELKESVKKNYPYVKEVYFNKGL